MQKLNQPDIKLAIASGTECFRHIFKLAGGLYNIYGSTGRLHSKLRTHLHKHGAYNSEICFTSNMCLATWQLYSLCIKISFMRMVHQHCLLCYNPYPSVIVKSRRRMQNYFEKKFQLTSIINFDKDIFIHC